MLRHCPTLNTPPKHTHTAGLLAQFCTLLGMGLVRRKLGFTDRLMGGQINGCLGEGDLQPVKNEG